MEEDAPAGVPEWVVTYGDMMSLLLTFFIMLVSLSEISAEGKYRAILESIQQRLGYHRGPLAPQGSNFPLNSLIEQLKSLGSHSNTDKGRGGVRAQGPQGVEFRVFRRHDGTAINVGGPMAFAPGEARIPETLQPVLAHTAKVLAGKPNKIEIRGHASRQPLPANSPYADKYTLSYERARNVALYLEAAGVEHQRIRVSAAGDTELPPKTGDQRAWHPDRIEVLVMDTHTSEFAGERDIPD
jgi:chemotaxis protein MotB